ncbi:hypothetical protein RchiOBHm_Chr3g0448701 [Rosa chinensis]|uniref:Uncharacterized protein n=1 Tax=Rosa chinensis TaxID=74649 RepID=A0A2P6R5A4_ROSCH|nr:hypothetical protein RchiOBHm_Chr3g0448701 [Rosa chinensis]
MSDSLKSRSTKQIAFSFDSSSFPNSDRACKSGALPSILSTSGHKC